MPGRDFCWSRFPFSLLDYSVFAVWEIAQHKRAAAEVARMFGALLGGSVVFVLIFLPEIWVGPLVAWLKQCAPGWLYSTVVWILVGLGVLGLAVVARTASAYDAEVLT